MSPRVRRAALLAAALLVMLAVELLGARHKSLTYDEPLHYSYGQRLLDLHPERIYRSDNSKMPVTALNVLPGVVLQALGRTELPDEVPFPGQRLGGYLDDPLQAGRVVTMLASLALALLVFVWSRELYGEASGWLGLALCALSPTVLAHARLVTADVYAALASTLTLYLLWRFLRSRSSRDGLLCALALALALVTKYTLVTLVGILPLVALVYLAPEWIGAVRRREGRRLARGLGTAAWYVVVFGAVGLFVVNVAFVSQGTATPLADYGFRSQTMQALQARAGALGRLPLLLPVPFLDGLDHCKYDEEQGPDIGIYLHGRVIPGNRTPRDGRFRGFRGYFLAAALVKVPIATMLLVSLAAGLLLARRRDVEWRDLAVLLVPLGVWALYYNLAFQTQLGIRYLLPAFPLGFVLASGAAHEWARAPRWRRWAVPLLVGYLAISSLSYFPHHLSYFNEIVTPRTHAYRWLADSNIDWLQNQHYLDRYLAENPGAIVRPAQPVAGTVVVDVNSLVGIFGGPQRYAWLREGFEPVGHVAYSYLIYEVPAVQPEPPVPAPAADRP